MRLYFIGTTTVMLNSEQLLDDKDEEMVELKIENKEYKKILNDPVVNKTIDAKLHEHRKNLIKNGKDTHTIRLRQKLSEVIKISEKQLNIKY